ncbi:MAG: S8 family serine peptidase, partial [Opitutae bacterium]|nr:S8 family serine peptidase [Opitutae bacterium]
HGNRGELQLELISPSGTVSNLLEPHTESTLAPGSASYLRGIGGPSTKNTALAESLLPGIHDFTFSTIWNWGENSEGTWTLIARGGNTEGLINSLTLNVFGTKRDKGMVIVAENIGDSGTGHFVIAGDSSPDDSVDALAAVQLFDYEIQIDSESPSGNTFLWKKDGALMADNLSLSGGKQKLGRLFASGSNIDAPKVWDASSTDDIDASDAASQDSYIIQIDSVAALTGNSFDTFKWLKNDVAIASGIEITGLKQELADTGIQVEFPKVSGFTTGQSWTLKFEDEGIFILFEKMTVYPLETTWKLASKPDTDHDGMPDFWEQENTIFVQPAKVFTILLGDISIGATYIVWINGKEYKVDKEEIENTADGQVNGLTAASIATALAKVVNEDTSLAVTADASANDGTFSLMADDGNSSFTAVGDTTDTGTAGISLSIPPVISGIYNGIGATHFVIESDGQGTFRWGLGGLRPFEATAIEITPGLEQELAFGLKIRFDSTAAGKWTFSALELSQYFDDSHLDADGDGRTNLIEFLSGTNPIIKEPAPDDSDGDLLLDLEEILVYGTEPENPDTDGDGLGDGVEVYTHETQPTNPDTDNDGIDDRTELEGFAYDDLLDPIRKTDPLDSDSDNDGMMDGWERLYGLDPVEHDLIPLQKDTDRDHLSNYQEYLGSDGEAPIFIGEVLPATTLLTRLDFSGDFTNPTDPDSDSDTFSDFDERVMGTNPNDPTSSLHITNITRQSSRNTDSITWYSVAEKTYFLRYTTESPAGPYKYITDEDGNPREILGKRESRRTTVTHFTNGIPTWYRVEQKKEIPPDLALSKSGNPVAGLSTHKIGSTEYLKKMFGPMQVTAEKAGQGTKFGQIERIRLIQPSAGLPTLRVVETVEQDMLAGTETVVKQLAMAADRVLVQVRNETHLANLHEYAISSGAQIPSNEIATGLHCLRLSAATTQAVPAALQSLKGKVAFVEPDYVQRLSLTPNDPDFLNGNLWGLHNTGQNAGTDDADIDAPEGWDTRSDASDIIVAVIDTGVRYTHEDLVDNMWINPNEVPGNGVDDDNNGWIDDVHGVNAFADTGDPMDQQGHGTHCAGTIGGVGNNGIGIAGVAWDVQIMACQFLSPFGFGMTADAIECIDYARQQGAHIMSNSWGGGPFSQALFDAISRARDDDIIFTAAAGNSGTDNDAFPQYPASYDLDNIVAVAATDRNDDITWFSCFGATSVDIGAPGQDIYSSIADSDNSYDFFSGTSMACPHVSGALALIKTSFPNSSYDQLIQRMYASADPIPSLTEKCTTGARLNLAAAMSGGEAVSVYAELDTDNDGLTDYYELNLYKFYTPTEGWSEENEERRVTDVSSSDTDGDGIADGWEALMGLNPIVADSGNDPDKDGVTSLEEYLGLDETPPIYDYSLIESTVFRVFYGDFTRADISDTDGDGLPDGWEILYGLPATIPAAAIGSDIYFDANNIISTDTRLSIFRPGDVVIIKGSGSNDGTYTLDATIHQEAHKLTTLETFINEPAGLTVTVAKDTDQDGLADIDEYALKMREPYFSDDSFKATELMSGKVISSWSRPLVANDIHFAVDENAVGGPLYMIESKTTDLSFFAGEKHLTVTGTVYNNGNYTISLADPRIADPITVNKIYVLEPTDYETPGNEVTLDVDPREKAFDGIFSYPDEKDTDGDGASDGQEVLGIFGGSNPTDPNQSIATLSGKFLYTGIESGDYYLILTAYTYGKGEDPAGQLNELSFESASQTIRSSTGFFGGSKPEDFNKWDTFSIFGSNENDGVYTVVSTSVDGLTVKENITDENLPPADPEYNFTVFFRRNPQRLLIPGSGDENDAYAIGGIPTQLQYSITGFLDTNGNAVLDRLIDPHVHFLDGSLMLGTDFNELNIDLPNADPDGSNIRILSVTSDPLGSSLIRTITWKSIPGKTYRVRYSTASPAGPFDQYILGAGGAPKEIVGYVGQGKTSLIHFADDERTFYRVEVKSADPFKLESDIISFVAPTRAILASAPTFPPLLPGQRIWITGSTSNNGIYTVSRDVVATDQQIIIEEALLDETAGNLVTIASAGAQLPEMDTDADGLTDFYEEQLGLDPGQDTDGDGVLDDSDGDGNPDGWDSDGDGLPDGWEVLTGLTVFANDIHMANNKVYSSSAIELTGLTDVSFDSATRSIRSSQGSLSDTNQPAFIAGQKVIVSGSGLNSGTYTIVAANSIQITVAEEVQDEKAGRALSISSIGGSNLSVFSAGTTLEVKGFTNIGNFGIESSSENTIQVVGNLADEPTGTFDPNDESAYRGWITLFANDTEGDSDGDLLSNKEEFLGADDKSSGYNDYLIPDRLFDGDWTHPVFNDTDGDTIDDGWEIRYGLDPNQSNGLLGSDIGFRDNRVRSISSLVVSGQNIRFDGASSRILSLTNEFILLRQCRQVTIIGSDSNDGSFPIIDIGVAGDYMEVAPAASGAVIVDEKEGRPIMVHGDLEILSNDISFNGNTISSSPTTVTGNDIFFTAAGEIRNLGGQSIMGDDISFSGTTIRSHNGHFSSGTDDISFDAATSEIRSQVGILNGYAVGYPILVAGSANNNGLFIVQSVPVPGFTVVVNGPLQDEGAQNGGNNPQPKVINITAIGGTDLSSFISGYQVQVFGSLFNDGIYTVTGTPTFPTNTLDVGQLLFTESNGAFVDISYADTSSFSNFRAGQSITVTGSVTNNGTYTIGNALPSANLIQLAATGPAIVAEPANPFTAVTLTAQGVTDFSRFSRGAQIQVNGTSLNDGIYNISNDIAPTASQIQVVEPLTLEASGPDLEIFQLGPSSRLDAFNDNENVLINGSLGNDGTFIIDTNGVSPSTLFALPPKLFASEAAGSQITISKDLDSDGLPDVVEYHYNSNPNLRDTDADGDTDMDETGGFFGGSDPTDPDSVLRSINGLVRYSGIETGNIYIQVDEANRPFEENDTGDTIPSDLYFTKKDRTIRSSTGKLPYLTVGRQILISGTTDVDGDGVGDNDGVFTISKIIASKYAIEVDEELVDEGTI